MVPPAPVRDVAFQLESRRKGGIGQKQRERMP